MDTELRPVEFYLLLALADGDAHGYAIIQEIERRSGGAVRLQPGTLYRALGRMRRAGWVEPVSEQHGGARERRTYALTAVGREVARTEAERLDWLTDQARASGLLGESGR